MRIGLRESITQSVPRIREDAVIESRAQLLPPADRDLVVAVWIYHQPTRMLSELIGVPVWTVRRRVHMLIDRLHSDEFLAAARAMRFLNPHQAEVARLRFCHGLPLRATARAMGIRYHEARQLAVEVRGLINVFDDIQAEREGFGHSAASSGAALQIAEACGLKPRRGRPAMSIPEGK